MGKVSTPPRLIKNQVKNRANARLVDHMVSTPPRLIKNRDAEVRLSLGELIEFQLHPG